jgi:hypothetical protein
MAWENYILPVFLGIILSPPPLLHSPLPLHGPLSLKVPYQRQSKPSPSKVFWRSLEARESPEEAVAMTITSVQLNRRKPGPL